MKLRDLLFTLKDFNEFSIVKLDVGDDDDDCFLVISHPTFDIETRVRLEWLDNEKCEHCDEWQNQRNPTYDSQNSVLLSKASSICSKCGKASADGEYCENGLCLICCIDSPKCKGYREPEKVLEAAEVRFCSECGDEIKSDFGNTVCRSCDIPF